MSKDQHVNWSLSMLSAVLAHELDLLSDDDIENAPESAILSLLGNIPSQQFSKTDQMLRDLAGHIGPSLKGHVPSIGTARNPSYIGRDDLAAICLKKLRATGRMVLSGPSGSGKSFFLNQIFCLNTAVRRSYPRIVRLDCSALRMSSAALLEREAVWAAFGKRDDAFQRFLRETTLSVDGENPDHVSRLGSSETLVSLLQNKFLGPGLVVLDHIEYLNYNGDVATWLGLFCNEASKADIHVILCRRSPGHVRLSRAVAEPAEITITPLGQKEVEQWLGHPEFSKHREAGLTASEILLHTGGSPALLRDLIAFLRYEPLTDDDAPKLYGRAALEAFSRTRPANYITDCERYFRAARYSRELLLNGLTALNSGAVPARVIDRVVASGAVRQTNGQSGYTFSSPIHAERIKRLSLPENLLILAQSIDDRMVADGGLRKLKRVAEFASDPVSKYMAIQRKPHQALARFRQLLESWGFEATIHVRDPYNARLWCAYDKPHDVRPLSSFDEPDFAHAAQTGQLAVDEDGCLFIPSTGNSGVVEMIVEGKFRHGVRRHVQDIEVDRITGAIRSLRPTLAQTLERFALYRNRQLSERILHRMGFDDPSQGWLAGLSALKNTSCAALAILERHPDEWFATKLETASSVSFDGGWHEAPNLQRLDTISAFPSRRGLVLTGAEVWSVFPRLQGKPVSVYIRPVWVHRNRVCRLVVFIFEGDTLRAIDGQLQRQLASVAHELIASAS